MKTSYYNRKLLQFCLFTASIFLSGCVGHTVNEKPRPVVQPLEAFSISNDSQAFQSPWWHSFEREELNALIDQSLNQNYDVAASVAALKQARALSRQTGAQRLPQIDVAGDADKDWEGSDGQRGGAEIGAALSWELDIWNLIGASAKADQYEATARFEDVEAVKLSLSADVANAYFGAIAAQQRINLLEKQLKLDRDLQGLLQLRLDNGVGTSVDVLRQKARVADSKTLIPLAQSDLRVFENRLDVLLGEMPDAVPRVSQTETLDFSEDMPAIGVPSALLLNRPDLRAALAELVAADADIAAAIADRLPRVTLDGSFVYSDAASFTGPVSMIMGSFVQPLLDWGRRKAEVDLNKALYEERLAAYTQLFLEAVEDVESALIREIKQREFLKNLQVQKNILQQTVDASENRYTQGIDDYLPVINALQELRNVERSLITEHLNLLNIRVDLFRAIGGPIHMPSNKGHDDEIL